MLKLKQTRLIVLFVLFGLIFNAQGLFNEKLKPKLRRLVRRQGACPDANMCLSKWGYCGYTDDYCGANCVGGACQSTGGGNGGNGGGGDIINESNFQCVFNGIDDGARRERLDGLRRSGYKPENADEAAVFLAHVFHETDGLKTLVEYCAPGCGPNYAGSWCDIQGAPGQLYYGRGWIQLSYPCNYNAAGKALGLDLLNNPDLVSQQQDVAVKTAVWFFQVNNVIEPARRGDFAATTRIINGAQECNGGPGAQNQQTRVETYKRVRQCFGLGEPQINPTC